MSITLYKPALKMLLSDLREYLRYFPFDLQPKYFLEIRASVVSLCQPRTENRDWGAREKLLLRVPIDYGIALVLYGGGPQIQIHGTSIKSITL